MVVKDGKIYLALREIAPSSPYSADYLRIRILHGKLQGTKLGREWYTTSEWLAEYLSRYGQKIARAAAVEGKFPVRYTVEKQFVPLVAGEDARAPSAPAAEAAAAPVRKPDLPDIRPPLGKTIYDFPAAPERAAVSPPVASPVPALSAPPPGLAITRHPAHRELAAKLRSSLPLKFAAVPLTAAALSLFLSVAVAGGITPARVLGFVRDAAERAGSFALETPVLSPSAIAAAVGGEFRRVPHRLALASAGIAALPERLAAAAGDFLLTVAIPSPAEFAAWPDGVIARLEALPPLAGPRRLAAGLVDAVRDFIAGLPRPRLPERIARFFNLSSPPLTSPQANAPVRYALEPRDEKQEAGIKKQEAGTPVPPVVTQVREVVQTREVVRPADVSQFQAKLDQLNAGLRVTVNKLVADVAGLYEGAEIKTSVVRAFSPSQSIDELFNLKVDSGLTLRSGNLSISAGDLTVTGNGRFTGTLNSDGAFSAGSLGTGGLLTVSGNGTSSLAYGLTAATSGGAVGFGTSSPSQFFAVGGNGYFTGGLGLGTVTTSPGGFQTTGMAVIGSILDVRGTGTSTFAGPLVVAGALSVNAGVLTISSTSTVTTQVAVTRAAVTPHTFASWTTGTANSAVTDATLLINPASAVSDSNLFGIAIAGSPRFLVDAEGDIYGRNLILEGGTTQATTTLSGNLLVEGNATLGDAANADTHIIRGATILYASSTQAALTIWNSSNGDLLSLLSGTGQTPSTRFTFTNGGNLGIGSTTPTVGLSVATSTYITGGLGIGEATTSSGGLLVKGQGVFAQTLDIRGTGTSTFAGGLSAVGLASSNGLRVSAGDTVFAGGLAVTGSSNFTGSVGIGTSTPSHLLTVRGPFLVNGTSTIEGAGLITQALFSTTSLNFYTASNATPRLTIDASGNVGIGTTSPWGLLSVNPNGISGPAFAVGSSTQCVTGDTKLRRRRRRKKKDGSYEDLFEDVRIDEIKEGDEILTLDDKTGTLNVSRVKKLMPMGVKPIVKITTALGRTIRTTAEHPYLAKTSSPDLPREKPRLGIFFDDANMFYAQKKVGWNMDIIAFLKILSGSFEIVQANYYRAVPAEGDPARVSALRFMSRIQQSVTLKTKPLKYIKTAGGVKKKGDMDVEIALGVTEAVDRLDVIMIVSGDSDLLPLRQYASQHGKKIIFLGFKNNMAWELTTGGKYMYLDTMRGALALEELGEKQTPEPKLGVALVRLLYSRPPSVSSGGVWTKVKALQEGQEMAVLGKGDKPVWDTIENIEHLPAEQVYDIEVEGTHNFIGNGIVAHNTYLTVTNGGNVGIGTTSPATTLSTVGSGYFTGGLGAGYATTGAGNIVANDFILSRGRLGVNATGSPTVEFGVTGSGYLTGGLGVGEATTSSGGLLVKGQGVFAQTIDVRGAGTSTLTGGLSSAGLASSAGLRVSAGDTILSGGLAVIGSSNFTGSLGIGTSTPSHALTIRGPFLANGTSTIEGAGLIAQALFSTTSLNFYTNSNAAPRLTVDASGNVGIGTTSPGSLFAVNGPGLFVGTSTIFGGLNLESISATGTLGFYTRGTAAPRLVIDSSGNVGIGTTSPGRLLGLRGPFLANATSTIEGGGLIGQGLFSTTSLAFYTNSNAAARLFIEGGGNIGVGTTGPFALLSVNAPAGSASFAIGSTTATSFMVDEFGNVGIGGRPWPDTATVGGVVLRSKLFLTSASTSENFITAGVTASGQTINPVFIVSSIGKVFADNGYTAPADYAELLETVDTDLSPGELVSIDREHPNHVRRATTTADSRLMGIISTKPGIVGIRASDVTEAAAVRAGDEHWKQVAFLGQVPAQVTGRVTIGDYITSSDVPGVGRRANAGEPTVCIALEPHSGEDVAAVNCVISRNNRGYARLDPGIGAMASGDGLWAVEETTGRIKTIYPLDLSGNDILNVRSVLSQNGAWSIDDQGKLVASEITAREKLQVGSAGSPRGITLFDFDTGQPNCVFVQGGALRSVPGECTFSSAIESQAPSSSTQITNNEQNANDQTTETDGPASVGITASTEQEPITIDQTEADGLQAAGSTSPEAPASAEATAGESGTDAAGSETVTESTAPAAEPQPEPTTDATTSSEPAADSATATSTPAA